MMWVGPIQPAEVLNRRTDLPWARVNFASRWFSDLNWLLNWLFLVLQLAGPSCSFWTCLPPWYSRIVWADSLNLSVCIFASLVAQMVTNLPAMRRPVFNPWVGKIPWRREWLPTPIFFPGEFHGPRSLVMKNCQCRRVFALPFSFSSTFLSLAAFSAPSPHLCGRQYFRHR